MYLWCAVVLFAVCFAGDIWALRKWKNERNYVFLALWILLSIVSVILALYTALTFILLNAV